eukprot:326798-Amphidinium_carterae.1
MTNGKRNIIDSKCFLRSGPFDPDQNISGCASEDERHTCGTDVAATSVGNKCLRKDKSSK